MSSIQTIVKQNLKTAISGSSTFQILTDTTSAEDAADYIYVTACDPVVPGCLIYLGETFTLRTLDTGVGMVASGDVIYDLYLPVTPDVTQYGDIDEIMEAWAAGICDDVLDVAVSDGLLLVQNIIISSVMYPGDKVVSDTGDFRVVTTTVQIGLNI